jgi:predicted nucleic acid-binding protein
VLATPWPGNPTTKQEPESLVEIIGPIRQEGLSGFSQLQRFEDLRSLMASLIDLPIGSVHLNRTAEFSNRCRRHGVQGSNTDGLICAVAVVQRISMVSAYHDFQPFAKRLPTVWQRVRA